MREGENEKKCVVLLHGFGADAGDLFPLADLLDPSGEWTFVHPQAPHEVPIGPGWTGRGWFPISVRDLETGVDFSQVRPPGLDQSAAMVSELIFELDLETCVLGGFSQGAMVATEVALENPRDANGLVLWSGTLLDEPGWSRKMSALEGKKFLQAHGVADQVLPIGLAQKLFDMLKAGGADGGFLQFAGGHEIPMPVIKKTAEFIAQF